eukprot:scaffold6012_cov106-Isochrysis_galbana.AAC.1
MATNSSWTGRPRIDGSTKSVAPSCPATANLSGLVSMAKMRLAPAAFAAWTTARPTAPSPNTATDAPGST